MATHDRYSIWDFVKNPVAGSNYHYYILFQTDSEAEKSSIYFDHLDEAIAFFYNIGWEYDKVADCFHPKDEYNTTGFIVVEYWNYDCGIVDMRPENFYK